MLDEAGIDPSSPPTTVDDFLGQLETLKGAGVTALSIATTWTQVNLLEAVLMATLGATAYNGLFDGSTDWSGSEVTTALEQFEAMMGYTNTDRDGLDWPDATQQLIDGTAGYNVMGDWAVAAFEQAELAPPQDDYVYFELGGADRIFGFLADSFTLPDGAPPHPGGGGGLAGHHLLGRRPARLQPRQGVDPGPHGCGHLRVRGSISRRR